MSDSKSWIKIIRDYDLEPLAKHHFDEEDAVYKKKIAIKDDFDFLTTDKLKTSLKDHQKRTVKAMIDLENIRSVKVINNGSYLEFKQFNIESCAGIVSEKPGSGKTYEIFALIAENKKIPIIPEITSLPNQHKFKNRIIHHRHNSDDKHFEFEGFTMEVRRFYKKIFKPTLIFVGKSVIKQWEEKIERDTYFKAFVINDIFTLREFTDMVFKNPQKINTYDIILVKNGNISGKFDPEQMENKNFAKLKTKPILTIFAELFKQYCWTRVVLDDFDNLNIPSNANVIPALFTWLISATKKEPMNIISKQIEKQYSIQSLLKNYRPRYNDVWKNKDLFTFFNIGCDDAYINASLSAPIIKYNVYKFKNPNDTFIGLVSHLGNTNIAEMLNGDATGEAAAAVGLVTDSVSVIFEKLLSKSWHLYKKNIEVEKYINKVKEHFDKLESNEEKPYKQTQLDGWCNNLLKPGPYTEILKIDYKTIPLMQMTSETENKNKLEKQETGKPIQRVKDRLKDNECPIMCVALSECQNIVIMKCCGTALSDDGFKVILSSAKSDCCNCRAKVTKNDVIIISESLGSIETIIDNIMEDKLEIPEPKTDNTDKQFNEKITTMLNIINGGNVSEYLQTKSKIEIRDILHGDADLGFVNQADKKFIVYSGFKESTVNIEEILKINKIKFARLQGSVKHIDELKKRYWLNNSDPNAIKVLIISGTQYCAGLDLQNTSDIIFMHKVVDINNEIQIAGRAARYGRTSNLNIHFLFYHNELHVRLQGPGVTI